jgi:hypothetical protein
MNQPGKPSRTGITGSLKVTASELRSPAENTRPIENGQQYRDDEVPRSVLHLGLLKCGNSMRAFQNSVKFGWLLDKTSQIP